MVPVSIRICAVAVLSSAMLQRARVSHCKSILNDRSWYKTPDDKPINSFGFDEKYLDVAETKKVIEETHDAWKKLRSGDTDAGKLWTGK